MRIRRYPDLQIPDDHVNSEFLADATPTRPPRSKRLGRATRKYEKAVREAQIAIDDVQSGKLNFQDVQPCAVIGLFILLHTKVYGVEPEELLDGNVFAATSAAVKRLIDVSFGSRIDFALDFVRWTWAREKRQFAQRKTDWRIGWRWQFCSNSLLTDYRIAMAKTPAL